MTTGPPGLQEMDPLKQESKEAPALTKRPLRLEFSKQLAFYSINYISLKGGSSWLSRKLQCLFWHSQTSVQCEKNSASWLQSLCLMALTEL